MTFWTQFSKNTEIFYKTEEEIELIRKSCMLVAKTLGHVASRIRPGIKGSVLDKEAEELEHLQLIVLRK